MSWKIFSVRLYEEVIIFRLFKMWLFYENVSLIGENNYVEN